MLTEFIFNLPVEGIVVIKPTYIIYDYDSVNFFSSLREFYINFAYIYIYPYTYRDIHIYMCHMCKYKYIQKVPICEVVSNKETI